MCSDNLQLSGAKKTAFSADLYPTTASPKQPSVWRPIRFITLSLLAHMVFVLLFLRHYSVQEYREKMAGSAGGGMQLMMMPAAIDDPSAELSQHPVPVEPASLPESAVTLPKQPTAVIKLPEKASRQARVSRQSQVKTAAKQSPSQVVAREVSDSLALDSSSISTMSAGAMTVQTGESDGGRAKQGAGSANTHRLKALHRRVNYPVRAKAMGVEGKVRIKFDITGSGTVTNIRVLSENPDGVFGDEVMKDMARWRYQTQTSVENQIVSIVFKLDGRIQFDN